MKKNTTKKNPICQMCVINKNKHKKRISIWDYETNLKSEDYKLIAKHNGIIY